MGKLSKLAKAAKVLSQGDLSALQDVVHPPSTPSSSTGQGKWANVGAIAQQVVQGVQHTVSSVANSAPPPNHHAEDPTIPNNAYTHHDGYQAPNPHSQWSPAPHASYSHPHQPPIPTGSANPYLTDLPHAQTPHAQTPHAHSLNAPTHAHMPGPASMPTGNAADFLQAPKPPPPTPTLIPLEFLEQISTRPHSAEVGFGHVAVLEARKGLSRPINISDRNDLEFFATQLRNCDRAACLVDSGQSGSWSNYPIFALSYEHCNPPVGRFKFSEEQWFNLLAATEAILKCGITVVHLWLDQCLWLRDASQECWAHTGLMPYTLYPVISLGAKRPGGQRTLSSYSRMWPFVEEVVALWSMGLIVTRELRDRQNSGSSRRWLSFNSRERLQPEYSFRLILLDIYHGAVDHLQTGWSADVEELREMAHWNFLYDTNEIVVGSNWRMRLANMSVLSNDDIIHGKLFFTKTAEDEETVNTYLDGSRQVPNHKGWDGYREWQSGNEGGTRPDSDDHRRFQSSLYKASVMTNVGEFQLLCVHRLDSEFVLWLLVAMEGRSCNFGRGRVSWTKILQGEFTCSLGTAIEERKNNVVAVCIEENLVTSTKVSVSSISIHEGTEIEWV